MKYYLPNVNNVISLRRKFAERSLQNAVRFDARVLNDWVDDVRTTLREVHQDLGIDTYHAHVPLGNIQQQGCYLQAFLERAAERAKGGAA